MKPLQAPRDEWLTTGRAVVLIGVCAVAAYANALTGAFVFDDVEQIVQNPGLRSWDNLGTAFTSHVWAFREHAGTAGVPPPLPYYRPLFTALFTLQYQIFGLWPPGWHLVSLTLHILCSLLVLRVVQRVCADRVLAVGTALLFAVHPVHTQSVAWISGVTDPLFAVFYLGSLAVYLDARQRASGRRAVAWLLFVVAAFCKETALSLPLLVFLYEAGAPPGGLRQRLGRALRQTAPFLVAALVYLVPRYLVLGELMWTNPQAPDRPLSATLLTLPFVLCSYLFHLAWPVGLSITYATSFVTSPGSPRFLVPLGALIALAAGAIALRRRFTRPLWFAIGLIVVPLLPVLRLGGISREEYLVFDHYLYLSVAGWSYLVTAALMHLSAVASGRREHRAPAARRLFTVTMGGVLVASILLCARENRSWADSRALWSNVVRVRPAYWSGHYNLGLTLLDAGAVADARQALETAAQLNPDEAYVFAALGRVTAALGDPLAAIGYYRRALALQPDQLESLNNLAVVFLGAGDYAQAEVNLRHALAVDPRAVATRSNLVVCLLQQEKFADAVPEAEQLVQDTPNDAFAHYQLGIAYEGAGRRSDAVRTLMRARDLATSADLQHGIAELLRAMAP